MNTVVYATFAPCVVNMGRGSNIKQRIFHWAVKKSSLFLIKIPIKTACRGLFSYPLLTEKEKCPLHVIVLNTIECSIDVFCTMENRLFTESAEGSRAFMLAFRRAPELSLREYVTNRIDG